MPPIDVLESEAISAYQELTDYFYSHAIWLDPETESAVKDLIQGFWNLQGFRYASTDPVNETLRDQAWKQLTDELVPAIEGVHSRFRAILGVDAPEDAED